MLQNAAFGTTFIYLFSFLICCFLWGVSKVHGRIYCHPLIQKAAYRGRNCVKCKWSTCYTWLVSLNTVKSYGYVCINNGQPLLWIYVWIRVHHCAPASPFLLSWCSSAIHFYQQHINGSVHINWRVPVRSRHHGEVCSQPLLPLVQRGQEGRWKTTQIKALNWWREDVRLTGRPLWLPPHFPPSSFRPPLVSFQCPSDFSVQHLFFPSPRAHCCWQ